MNGKNIKIEYQRISSKDMIPHPIAQRDFIPNHGKALAKAFTWEKYTPIDVSFRDGKYWVIDGQHRLYAAKMNNGGRDLTLLCRVHYGMTMLDEANFFLTQDKGKKNILIHDKLRVMYKIGDEGVNDFVRCCTLSGWNVDEFKTDRVRGRITAFSTAQKAYKALGSEKFMEMLSVLKEAYNGDPESVSREMLNGMTLFFKTYYGDFKNAALAKSMHRVSPAEILRDGKSVMVKNRATAVARAILRVFNNNRRSYRLDDKL